MTLPSQHRREPSDLPPGTVINGKFRVVSLLATGGMGRIYRAEQAPLGRLVALKVLRIAPSESTMTVDEFRKRFVREASILARLQHTNVVTLFDYGRIEGISDERYFIAMEYLAGETLTRRLRRCTALPVPDAFRIIRQIARGLREAHKLGAVHRDLKPSNVMLVPQQDGDEIVKILDFGIGKIVGAAGGGDDQDLTQEGAFLGSPKYIAPEQVNERRIDARTDVYALGVIAYECLCGRVPFEGETNLETILAHCNGELKPMAQRTPGVVVPEIVEALVRRCLEKDPDRRPQSMEEVLRAIGDCERALYGTTSIVPGLESGPPPSLLTPLPMPIPGPPALPRAGHGAGSGSPGRPSLGTAAPFTRSEHGAPAPSAWRPAVIFVAAASVVLVAAGVGVVQFARRPERDGARRPSPAVSVAMVAPPSAPTSFTLVLDSRPSGANVWDGEDLLGTTPVQLTVDRASTRNAPRRFVIRLDGYMPYTVLQGDSEGVVPVTAPLTPLGVPSSAPSSGSIVPASVAGPAASASAPRHPARWPYAGSTGSAPGSPRGAQQDLDIKLER
jgi:serine/threonine-protein kinase